MFQQEEREGRNTCVGHQSVPGKKGEEGGRDVNKGAQVSLNCSIKYFYAHRRIHCTAVKKSRNFSRKIPVQALYSRSPSSNLYIMYVGCRVRVQYSNIYLRVRYQYCTMAPPGTPSSTSYLYGTQ